MHDGQVLAGFAGSTADAFALFASASRPSSRSTAATSQRAAVELAKEWRTDRMLRRLEALLVVADREPPSCCPAPATSSSPTTACWRSAAAGPSPWPPPAPWSGTPTLDARGDRRGGHEDRGRHLHLHERPDRGGGPEAPHGHPAAGRRRRAALASTPLTPARDRGRARPLRRRARPRPSARWPSPCATASAASSSRPEMAAEVTPKNILMIGPTGVGKTEIARRLARLAGSPFLKVEATKFTEVGYVGPRRGVHGPRPGRKRRSTWCAARSWPRCATRARAQRRGAAARPAPAAAARTAARRARTTRRRAVPRHPREAARAAARGRARRPHGRGRGARSRASRPSRSSPRRASRRWTST